MDARTLTALRQSIEKWERNATAETPCDFTLWVHNCPLCEAFGHDGCLGCPVKGSTGLRGCIGTPYYRAFDARIRWFDAPSDTALRDAAHVAARAEVAFLRSLLPEAEATP